MASITIRKLDDAVKVKLRIRAAQHGRSMEEEAREILQKAVMSKGETSLNIAQSIRKHLADAGLKGFDMPVYDRRAGREPVDFSGPEYGIYEDEEVD